MPRPLQARCLADIATTVRHGFFTREGGVSPGIYTSLNCGPGSRDDRDAVIENRARAARWLGASSATVMTPHQVHSATAIIVEKPFPSSELPRADALVTKTPGLAIGALAADCTPVLFADPEARVVAAAHAGWRGALAGILEQTIVAMESIGAKRASIRAAVGPCINQAAYEVGPEFEAQFVAASPGNARYFRRLQDRARPHFDLPGYVENRLECVGLHAVERTSPCTYENESMFFSFRRATHRREADYGRQVSAILVT